MTPSRRKRRVGHSANPDDVAIDSSRNVYMTDLPYSGIWKISFHGKKVDLWSAHPLPNWSSKPYSGFPPGVNDLVLDKQKNIYCITDGDALGAQDRDLLANDRTAKQGAKQKKPDGAGECSHSPHDRQFWSQKNCR